MTELEFYKIAFFVSAFLLAVVSLLFIGLWFHTRDLDAALEAATERAAAHCAASGTADETYARCRELTAMNAGLTCELTETHDRLEDALGEVKDLRLQLWSERKVIRDLRKVLETAAAEPVASSTAERAG